MTSTALTVLGVVGAIVQGGLIGKFTKKFGERRVLIIGMALTAVSLLALSYAQPYMALFPVLVVMGFGNGLVNPSISSLISRSAPANEQGLTLGLSQSLSALARAIGPAWGGFLFEPNYHVPYLSSAVLVVVATGLALSIRKKEV
jgi:MFS family permease